MLSLLVAESLGGTNLLEVQGREDIITVTSFIISIQKQIATKEPEKRNVKIIIIITH